MSVRVNWRYCTGASPAPAKRTPVRRAATVNGSVNIERMERAIRALKEAPDYL